jgi:hypothetical protein
MKNIVSTCVLKILPCYTVWWEPELQEPEPHQNFHPEPEPHKNDAAPQHCYLPPYAKQGKTVLIGQYFTLNASVILKLS